MASSAPSEIVTAAVAAWISHCFRKQHEPFESQTPYRNMVAVGGVETEVIVEPQGETSILATTAGCRYCVQSNWKSGQNEWQGMLGAEPLKLSVTQRDGDLLVCDGKLTAVVRR